ncbi:anaerobic ribonucleoside-triphosphate reductase activating protein [Clostridium tyrobutyricum]|uniref:anaerobic ribonucleoside-triphosphate reductase activating protein n=1 Tax=Clostridium tyrobutyricum TaxID=1519 RepID=UPI003AF3B875
MEHKRVRLSGIAYESLVNGPGLRRVYFAQGCGHNCRGCFNPSTHSFYGGELRDINMLVEDIKSNSMIHGVTFSGGDPFYQAEEFSYMAKKIKTIGLNIWCYTGYKIEYILDNKIEYGLELLKNIDVLVDGKFDENKKAVSLKFRGSSNQRIIDVRASINLKNIVLIDI